MSSFVVAEIDGTPSVKITDGTNTAAVSSPGRLDTNAASWIGSTAPSVGQKPMASSIPVVLASDAPPLLVSLSNPDALPLTVGYDRADTVPGAQAGYWFKGAEFVVPAGRKFAIGQYNSYSEDNRVSARAASILKLGDWNPTTFAVTNPAAYASPVFGAFLELEVLTMTGNVDDQVITITYTNELGVTGRVATATSGLKLKKNTPVGYKLLFSLQAGDVGIRSVQSVTADKTNTGDVQINGGIDFYLQSMDTPLRSYITVPSAANPILTAGEKLSLDIMSTGGATVRRVLKVIGNLT